MLIPEPDPLPSISSMVLISGPPFRMLEFLAQNRVLCFLFWMEENVPVELLASPETNDQAWTALNKEGGETARL